MSLVGDPRPREAARQVCLWETRFLRRLPLENLLIGIEVSL